MKKKTWFVLSVLGVLLFTTLNAVVLDNFVIMTEQYPPYNFEQNGLLKGIATDIMVEMFKRDGSKKTIKDIQLLPWARGYKDVQDKPNTILFAMTRSAEREKMFKWVGPISPTKIVLHAKKSKKISIKSKEDIAKYHVGAIREDIGHQLLEKAGVKNVDLSADMISNIKKLEADRIDLWAYEENVARWELKTQGKNLADYESVYTLLSSDLYFAFHKSTPDATISQIQKYLNDMKKDGTYQKIMDKYLK
ncbi:MAG TPA: ABC transporter substrate-binding protein [Candidatus Cloacimonadota bacterium]|nr:ABC transporter substrate-binding protein [Candidatus Cloacimonadota bacterium]HOD53759.1 ABC transporter substrate-binding protein [Candidatus Cloacimonadota bacterium]